MLKLIKENYELGWSSNIKLNALCKETLYEKIKSDIPGEINKSVSDELDEIKKRISQLENSQKTMFFDFFPIEWMIVSQIFEIRGINCSKSVDGMI